MKVLVITLGLLILFLPDSSSKEKTLESILFEAASARSDEIVVENYTLSATENINEYLIGKLRLLNSGYNGSKRIKITPKLIFKNCRFKNTVSLESFNFTGGLHFIGCVFVDSDHYQFDNLNTLSFYLINSYISEFTIENTSIKSASILGSEFERLHLEVYDLETLWIGGNKFYGMVDLGSYSFRWLALIYNTFYPIVETVNRRIEDKDLNRIFYGRPGKIVWSRLYINCGGQSGTTNPVNDFWIEDNLFVPDPKNDLTVKIQYGIINNARVKNNVFNSDIAFHRLVFADRLEFEGNRINGKISFTESTFSETYNKIPWRQFDGNKICVYQDLSAADNPAQYEIKYLIPYYAETELELENVSSFESLTSTYRSLYNIYKSRGDVISANMCYSEMSDILSRRLSLVEKKSGRLDDWFRWRLSQLLRWYTKYGTDPAQAIVASFKILLVFAAFYFFFPSDWDVTSKKQLIRNLKEAIDRNQPGTAKSIAKAGGLFVLSFINAITLSLNAFVTLGFGTIPTRGVARYVCILQGFLGWFLLSLFSVALINQVLF